MPFLFPELREGFDPLRSLEWNDPQVRCKTLLALNGLVSDMRFSRDTERYVFALCEGDHDAYVAKMKQLLWALSINKAALIPKYTPPQLVVLEEDILAAGTESEEWRRSHMQKVKSYQQLINSKLTFPEELLGECVRDAMRCRKCHSTDFSVVMRQTRSADEPMTAHMTCDKCGFRWKIN